MITTILFDLDGTLLPMDQDKFVKSYLGRMANKLAPQGFDPDLLVKGIWKGTGAMVKNDGSRTNETVFWEVFNSVIGKDCKIYEELFLDYYRNEFQLVAKDCGFDPRAAQAIDEIKAMGYHVALATNPLFPAIASYSRTKWAGLNPDDFDIITTYENSRFCKPNPAYYVEIAEKMKLDPKNCLMVGNNEVEDIASAQSLGMDTFYLNDFPVCKGEGPETPKGSFEDLIAFLQK